MNETRRQIWRFMVCSAMLGLFLFSSGCALPWNPSPTTSERQSLNSIVRLSDGFENTAASRFSSDGQWIVFHANQPGRPAGVYLAQVQRNDEDAMRGIRRPIPITPPGQSGGTAAFSSNGISLFLSSGDGGADKPGRLPTMQIFRADGWQGAVAALAPGKRIDLARHPITSGKTFNAQVDVSPSGNWIVFTSTRDGDPELYLMPPDGGEPRRLTHHKGFDGWGRFSPDGKQLLFQRLIDGRMQIMLADFIFDNDGNPAALTHLRQLTRNEDGGDWPCWHPDGRHILYSATAPNGDVELYVMRADGSRPTRLTFTPAPDVFPALSPDGNWLIWSSGRGAPSGTAQLHLARFTLPEGS